MTIGDVLAPLMAVDVSKRRELLVGVLLRFQKLFNRHCLIAGMPENFLVFEKVLGQGSGEISEDEILRLGIGDEDSEFVEIEFARFVINVSYSVWLGTEQSLEGGCSQFLDMVLSSNAQIVWSAPEYERRTDWEAASLADEVAEFLQPHLDYCRGGFGTVTEYLECCSDVEASAFFSRVVSE